MGFRAGSVPSSVKTSLRLGFCGIGLTVFMTPGPWGLRLPGGRGREHCGGASGGLGSGVGPSMCGPGVSGGVPLPLLPQGLCEGKGTPGGVRRIVASWGRWRPGGGPGPP